MKSIQNRVQLLLQECWDLMLSDPSGASKLAEQAFQLSSPEAEDACTAQTYWALCDIYQNEFESAIERLNPALTLAQRKGYERDQLRINNALGISYQAMGRYSAAYDHFEYAKEQALQLDDIKALTPSVINLSGLLFDMGHIDSAEHELNGVLGLDLTEISEDNLVDANILQTQIMLSMVRFDEAELILTQTERKAAAIRFQHAILRCKILRGRLLRLRGDLKSAVQILQDLLEDPLMEAESQETVTAYIELAKAMFSSTQVDMGVDVLTDCVERLNLSEPSTLRLRILEQLATGYQLQGNTKLEASCLWEIREIEHSAQVQNSLQSLQRREFKRKQDQARLDQRLQQRENQLLKKSYDRLQMLNDVAHQITMTLDFKELGRRLHSILAEHVDVHFVSLATVNEQTDAITFRFIIDDGEVETSPDIPFDRESSNSIQALKTRKPVLVNDLDDLSENAIGSGIKPRSMLFVPLIQEDQLLGVFSMQSPKAYRFMDYELDLMVAISRFIAIATSNILSHERVHQLNRILTQEKQVILDAQERIEHMAYHDSLTSLPNRQALEEVIAERIEKDPGPFYLVYIDLDGFKPVNDRFGHRHGDRVLIDIAVRLKETLRAGDFAARIGGDEFVLLVDAFEQRRDLQSFLKRLLQVIEQPILGEAAGITVSASIGASCYPANGHNLDALMNSADQAMYEIKRSGKGGINAL